LNGGTLVFIDKKMLIDPRGLRSQIIRDGVNILFVTTALFNLIASDFPECFSGLKYLLFGGEAVSVRSVQRIIRYGRPDRLLHVYGPTECTTFSTWHLVEGDYAETVPIGRPLSNLTAYVLSHDRQLLPT